jgi:hypothetical protein
MRLAVVVVLVLTEAFAQAPEKKQYQTGFCPRTAELEAGPSQKYWFEGALGQKHVRMYLERGGEGVVGVMYDTVDWVPLTLGGRWIAGKETIEVTAFTERDAMGGVLKGQATASGFTGVWSQEGGENGLPFRLKTVTQPKCDGSERWKTFEDGRWPVSFSYPGSWHVSTSADSITLTCPDASLMAYDGYEIDVKQGAEANTVTSDFIQCENKWIYGYDCRCDNATRCKIAPAADQGGMTMLRGDKIEWRVYCRGGGYVATGSGDRRVLTFGDTWIVVEGEGPPGELVERIVGTAKKRH